MQMQKKKSRSKIFMCISEYFIMSCLRDLESNDGRGKKMIWKIKTSLVLIFFNSSTWNVSSKNQESKKTQVSELLAEDCLPITHERPNKSKQRYRKDKQITKRQGGLLGSSAEHRFLAIWGEIREVRHQPDLKQVRETRSNRRSFLGNTGSKRKSDEPEASSGRSWWISILGDISNSTEQGPDQPDLTLSFLD